MNYHDPKKTSSIQLLNSSHQFEFCSILFFLILFYSCSKIDSALNTQSVKTQTNTPAITSSKPNIVFILGDDVGYEIPTVDGGESYSTPNLDLMAQAGMKFTECRASPLCSPSRFMLLTGKYNFRNYNLWGIMDTSNRTIANMLRDAGYKTCVAGKWQLSGGDVSIHSLGFDDYMVWGPFTSEGNESAGKGSRYKDPQIYTDSAYLPQSEVQGKYGDDFFTNFILNFIDSNKTRPFFAYYPICLVHPPFSPTPNDAEFATWDPRRDGSDKRFFPSMVNYMDEKVGMVIDHIRSLGIANNTLVIFVGDNGTSDEITSLFNGIPFPGGKGHTRENGTHIAMFAWWQGKIVPGSVNEDLIDFTDFLPTLAGVANIPVPTTYGVLDGVSFYPRLLGQAGTPRDWVFCHYAPNPIKKPDYVKRWVQDKAYKLYDTTYKFYNFINDPGEISPLKDAQLTPEEKQTKANFMNVLSTMHN